MHCPTFTLALWILVWLVSGAISPVMLVATLAIATAVHVNEVRHHR